MAHYGWPPRQLQGIQPRHPLKSPSVPEGFGRLSRPTGRLLVDEIFSNVVEDSSLKRELGSDVSKLERMESVQNENDETKQKVVDVKNLGEFSRIEKRGIGPVLKGL